MDKNSTRRVSNNKIAFTKTPIKQNKAVMGLRTSITPVASPKAAAAIPMSRVKSHPAQNKAVSFKVISPCITKEIPKP
jgi:hypothetical protein